MYQKFIKTYEKMSKRTKNESNNTKKTPTIQVRTAKPRLRRIQPLGLLRQKLDFPDGPFLRRVEQKYCRNRTQLAKLSIYIIYVFSYYTLMPLPAN